MRNVALRLSYDGTAYHGWQKQKNAITVCEKLEQAIQSVTGETVSLIGCGRTDSGVHAKTYVANFRTESGIPAERFPFALNSCLPQDIAVSTAVEVDYDFHATFSAIAKEYTYVIYSGKTRDPFQVNRAYWTPVAPDIKRVNAAAAQLVGEHDFAAFRSVGSNVKTSVRTMYEAEVSQQGETVQIRLCANGFLYNMARSIAGTLLYVSLGKLEPENIDALFKSGNRAAAGPTLPPWGLYMTGVFYNEEI